MGIYNTTADDAGQTVVLGGTAPITVNGGSGDDIFEIGANTPVTINGGAGKDVIKFTDSAANYTTKLVGSSVVFTNTVTGKIATVPVTASGDTVQFGNGAPVTIAGSSATNVMVGTQNITSSTPTPLTGATGTATSTTTIPTFSIAAGAASVVEGNNATFTVTLSAAQGTTTTVNYTLAGTGGAILGTDTSAATVAGTNVTSTATTLTFAPGATTATVTVPVTFDTLAETGEGISLTLTSPSTGTSLGANAVALTALANPAAPTFTLTSNAVAGAANEEGSTVTYTITPSGVTDKAYTFTLNTQGDTVNGVAAAGSAADFSPASQTVTFAAGVTAAQTVVQTIVNDGITEGLEGYKTSLLDSSFVSLSSKTGLITDPTSGTLSGTTYALTTATDAGSAFAGTNGNDTFIGTASDTAAATDTFTAVDVLGGGAGTGDVMNITFTGTNVATPLPAATVTGIETINIRSLQSTAATVLTATTGNFTGALDFYSDRSTSAVTFSTLAAGQSFGTKGNTSVTNGALIGTYANSVTTGTINISGGTTAGAITENGTGITSNTINSTGAKNTVGAIVLSGTANTALTINADTALVTGGLTGFTGTTSTITVSGAATNTAPSSTTAGNAAVVLGTIEAATVKTINAAGLTAGGVSATLNANAAFAFTGGQGNDLVTTGVALTTGTVAAGAGTGDTLVLAADAHINSTTLGAKYTGFEIVSIGTGGSTLDMDNLSASNTLTGLRVTGTATLTNVNAATAANVQVLANSTLSLGVKNALTPSQIDTASLTVNDEAAAVATITLTAPVLAGVEVLNLVATENVTITTLANALALTNLNISGAGNVIVTTLGAVALQTNYAINAGTATGNLTIDGTGATTNGFSVIGSAGINTITGGSQIMSANLAASTAKADIIAVTNATGGTLALPNAVISSFTNSATVAIGDKVDVISNGIITGAAVAAAATSTSATITAALSATGILTFTGTGAAAATLAQKIAIATEAAYGGATQYQESAFEHNGNTYIVENGDATAGFIAGTDVVIQLTGVTGVTALSTTASGATTVWAV